MATFQDQLDLCDTLRAAAWTANALDGRHAMQSPYAAQQGTYGMISNALIMALTIALQSKGMSPRSAKSAALRINEESVYSGITITEAYAGWVRGAFE